MCWPDLVHAANNRAMAHEAFLPVLTDIVSPCTWPATLYISLSIPHYLFRFTAANLGLMLENGTPLKRDPIETGPH